jgi:hypothetical protein
MALNAGNAACTTGLSSRIYNNLTGDPSSGAVANAALKSLCYNIALAVVAEIQANASVPGTGLVAPNGGGPVTGAAAVQ